MSCYYYWKWQIGTGFWLISMLHLRSKISRLHVHIAEQSVPRRELFLSTLLMDNLKIHCPWNIFLPSCFFTLTKVKNVLHFWNVRVQLSFHSLGIIESCSMGDLSTGNLDAEKQVGQCWEEGRGRFSHTYFVTFNSFNGCLKLQYSFTLQVHFQ